MQIGRFFALGQGRVGQYLSPRVLMVRSPFRRTSLTGEPIQFCCIGFGSLRQAQKFLRSVAHLGLSVELRQSQILKNCSYEVVVSDREALREPYRPDLASALAAWERQTASRPKLTAISPVTAPVAA